MTATERQSAPGSARRPLAPEARRAAARLVIAANTANGDPPTPASSPSPKATNEGREKTD